MGGTQDRQEQDMNPHRDKNEKKWSLKLLQSCHSEKCSCSPCHAHFNSLFSVSLVRIIGLPLALLTKANKTQTKPWQSQ